MMIAIIGMAASGKSAARDFFVNEFGFSNIYFGQVIKDAVKTAGLPLTVENERKYRDELRKQHGLEVFAVKVYDQILELKKKTDKILLESLYSWEEYMYLKARCPELVLVCVWARPTIRYERLKHRAERPITTSDEARSRDIAEIVVANKGGPIAIADFLVVNEGTIEDLREKLRVVYHEIEQGHYYPSTSPAKRDGAGFHHAAEQPTSH